MLILYPCHLYRKTKRNEGHNTGLRHSTVHVVNKSFIRLKMTNATSFFPGFVKQLKIEKKSKQNNSISYHGGRK